MRCIAPLLFAAVMACGARSAQQVGEPVPYLDHPTAKMLDAPPCPAESRGGIEGLAATEDWREVQGPGVRFCVPASWQLMESRLGEQWYGPEGSLVPLRDQTQRWFGPPQARDGRREGFVQQTIGGSTAELWYAKSDEANRPINEERIAGDRSVRVDPVIPGYTSVAIWRDRDLFFTGWSRSVKDIRVLRRVYQTVRFDK